MRDSLHITSALCSGSVGGEVMPAQNSGEGALAEESAAVSGTSEKPVRLAPEGACCALKHHSERACRKVSTGRARLNVYLPAYQARALLCMLSERACSLFNSTAPREGGRLPQQAPLPVSACFSAAAADAWDEKKAAKAAAKRRKSEEGLNQAGGGEMASRQRGESGC